MQDSPRAAWTANLTILAIGSLLMAAPWIASRRDADRAVPAAGTTELRAPATVTRVEQLRSGADFSPGPPSLRVCFILDSLDAIAEGDRSFYETMERDRLAALGPRC
ncbi:MAG: hypothetical protein ACP5FH_08480, partial [Terracidiphilus sp.]